jgi:hypothetical protein
MEATCCSVLINASFLRTMSRLKTVPKRITETSVMPSSTRSVGQRLYCCRGPRNVRARLCHPLRKRFCSAGFRADVFIAFHIREGSVPTQEYEILTAWLAQPPMIGFALQVQAMVALVWRAYFHALPSSCFCQQTSHISPSMRLSLISLWGTLWCTIRNVQS